MQAVIGGCRSCPFPCPRPGNRRPPLARREQLAYASFFSFTHIRGADRTPARPPPDRRITADAVTQAVVRPRHTVLYATP